MAGPCYAARVRLIGAVVLLAASSSLAGTRIIQNDRYMGTGAVQQVGLAEYEGGAVLFTPDPSDYPLQIVAIDVLVVPYQTAPAGAQGAYLLNVWDETGGRVAPPELVDGGTYRPLRQLSIALTTSSTSFNRIAITPLTVNAGEVFVSVTQQQSSTMDDTALAVDQGPLRRGNWFFNGGGTYLPVELPDGGALNGLRGNWIIRLVVAAPDNPVSVTSITPATAPTDQVTPVTIAGSNFELGAKAFVGATELTLTQFSPTSLSARVPAGLAVGRHDVKVRNTNGLEGVLMNGFTVTTPDGGFPMGGGSAGGGSPGGGTATGGGSGGGASGGGTAIVALQVDGITPAEAFADDETRASITGSGFVTGAQVFIGGVAIDQAEVRSAAVLAVTIPAKALPAGVHDVTVLNLSGARATAAKAFTVKAGSRTKASGCGSTSSTWLSPLVALALLLVGRKRRA